jgi:hypothetical protein
LSSVRAPQAILLIRAKTKPLRVFQRALMYPTLNLSAANPFDGPNPIESIREPMNFTVVEDGNGREDDAIPHIATVVIDQAAPKNQSRSKASGRLWLC